MSSAASRKIYIEFNDGADSVHHRLNSKALFEIAQRMRDGSGFTKAETQAVYDAGNLCLSVESADKNTPEKVAEAMGDVRTAMSWALPQYKCGNMGEKETFDYMLFCIARISPDTVMRAMVERLRLAESQAAHLEYLRSTGQLRPQC